jgi:hypothetical protein
LYFMRKRMYRSFCICSAGSELGKDSVLLTF